MFHPLSSGFLFGISCLLLDFFYSAIAAAFHLILPLNLPLFLVPLARATRLFHAFLSRTPFRTARDSTYPLALPTLSFTPAEPPLARLLFSA